MSPSLQFWKKYENHYFHLSNMVSLNMLLLVTSAALVKKHLYSSLTASPKHLNPPQNQAHSIKRLPLYFTVCFTADPPGVFVANKLIQSKLTGPVKVPAELFFLMVGQKRLFC
ncbi:hypothetical protein XENOCAPTIV_011151 [Xenoophorus captivus]|uniref:Uncharacterized protein n=1 Tax=Xenoophorus captivus TaxID=1517983 RepID=A0ABV0RYE4_9TELE